MSPIVCYTANGQWHAATAGGLIAYGCLSEAQLKAAISRIVDGDFAITYATPEVWRSTMLAAVAADALAAQEFIDAAEASKEVERLSVQLAMVLEAVESWKAELVAERERAAAEKARRKAEQQAAAAEAKKREAAVALQRQAAVEAQKRKAIEEDRVRDRRTIRLVDGSHEFSEAAEENIGGRFVKVRRIIQRFAPNEGLTAEAARWLR